MGESVALGLEEADVEDAALRSEQDEEGHVPLGRHELAREACLSSAPRRIMLTHCRVHRNENYDPRKVTYQGCLLSPLLKGAFGYFPSACIGYVMV